MSSSLDPYGSNTTLGSASSASSGIDSSGRKSSGPSDSLGGGGIAGASGGGDASLSQQPKSEDKIIAKLLQIFPKLKKSIFSRIRTSPTQSRDWEERRWRFVLLCVLT